MWGLYRRFGNSTARASNPCRISPPQSTPVMIRFPTRSYSARIPSPIAASVASPPAHYLHRFTSPMGAAAIASFLARGHRVTGRRSACPVLHRLLCPTPLLPLPDDTKRAHALTFLPLPSRAAPVPFSHSLSVFSESSQNHRHRLPPSTSSVPRNSGEQGHPGSILAKPEASLT